MNHAVQKGPTVVAKRWAAVCMDLETVLGPGVLWDTSHLTHTHVSPGSGRCLIHSASSQHTTHNTQHTMQYLLTRKLPQRTEHVFQLRPIGL
jgi:hypothetical protein